MAQANRLPSRDDRPHLARPRAPAASGGLVQALEGSRAFVAKLRDMVGVYLRPPAKSGWR